MKYLLYAVSCFLCFTACRHNQLVTMDNLLDELTDMQRLTSISGPDYSTVQFSSFDRRSISAKDSTWFANDDGFGGEPIPNFEEILIEPDTTGIGEYLICHVRGPGVIQRLWTASITGRIRLFLDDFESPLYEGEAKDFFRNPLEKLSGLSDSGNFYPSLFQYDASYFPIPFSKGCRIEWIGDIRDPHFYHIGLRLYAPEVSVESFIETDLDQYHRKLVEINKQMVNPALPVDAEDHGLKINNTIIEPLTSKRIYSLVGTKAIVEFLIKLEATNLENALRQTVLKIWFDGADHPQVHAPLGDFFGSAPGLNPFVSLPFSVLPDSTMICRFVMPFKETAIIEIENQHSEVISLSSDLKTETYDWHNGQSMHFRARWKIDHEITAYDIDSRVQDMPYLKASGSGRFVGAATYVYNPSSVPTSWGNWWGEGDEKIFIDENPFPSYFGTGSEDYYNYSWSSTRIFAFPFCGQPRNDGPGNRGYVSNFRWHIADDIPFRKGLEFYMELRHHGVVPDFTYGRITYYYALPSSTDDYRKIDTKDLRTLPYLPWSPSAFKGSAGWEFTQAERWIVKNRNIQIEEGNMWAEGSIVKWTPSKEGEELTLHIPSNKAREMTRIGLTLAHCPYGGSVSFRFNGRPVSFDNRESLSFLMPHRTILDNHFSEPIFMEEGMNELKINIPETDGTRSMLLDFVWTRQ